MTSILKFKFNDCPGSFAQERDRNGEGERKQKTMETMRRNRRGGRSSSWRNTYFDIYICCVWFSCVAVFSVSLPSPHSSPSPLSHFIVFGLWLHSKFISMTLRRRRRWSSSSASQLPREPQGLWHAPLAIIPAQHICMRCWFDYRLGLWFIQSHNNNDNDNNDTLYKDFQHFEIEIDFKVRSSSTLSLERRPLPGTWPHIVIIIWQFWSTHFLPEVFFYFLLVLCFEKLFKVAPQQCVPDIKMRH